MAIKKAVDKNKYRRYAEAKAKLPKWLPPDQYEAQIKALAKKYKI